MDELRQSAEPDIVIILVKIREKLVYVFLNFQQINFTVCFITVVQIFMELLERSIVVYISCCFFFKIFFSHPFVGR